MQLGMAFHELAGAVGVTLALLGSVAAQPNVTPQPMPQLGRGVALTPHARRLIYSAMGHMAAPRRLGLSSRSASGETLLPFIVKAWGGAESLKRAGFSARALSPSFAAVTLPPSELSRLWQVPGITQIDGGRRLWPRLDRSVPYVGASAMHELGVFGRGVMITIVDTGIDFRHPDFRHPDGSSRIAFLLDAAAPRNDLHKELPDTDNIAVYTKADLDAVLEAEATSMPPPLKIAEADTSGHGTHVAGIAAGNGRATGNRLPLGRYAGVAPLATLCIVKGTRADDSFADKDILTGVRFCVERAEAMHMPVAVNLSLGSVGGPHDGASAVELALDEIIGDKPGRALLAASGNSGTEDIHASSRLLDGSHEIPIKVEVNSDPLGGMSQVALELFFETTTPKGDSIGHIDIELRSPSGKVLKVPTGEANRGQFGSEGIGLIDNSDDTMMGLRGAVVLINGEDASSTVKSGEWKLRLTGSTTRYDLWIVDATFDLETRLTSHLDPDGYVEIPAAARSAISVGAMRTRADWKRPNGNQVMLSRELFRVAPFSSGGPTRDGRFAPDLLAPGEFIISSLSKDAPASSQNSVFFTPEDPGFLLADDGVHAVLRGTSQATPHVTGAVALLFELSPQLTSTAMRELLRTTTAVESGLASYGPRRGFGTLDLRKALLALRGTPLGETDANRSDLGVNYDAVAAGSGQAVVTVTPRDVRGAPLGPGLRVDILGDAGEFLGPTVDNGYGRYERVLVARGPRGTRATLQARVGGVLLNRSVTVDFVGDNSEIGAPYIVGSCAAAGATRRGAVPGSAAAFWFAIGALGLLFRRRGAPFLVLLGACSSHDATSVEPPPSSKTTEKPEHARRPRAVPGGDYYWLAGESLAQPSIVVHLREQMADIFDGDKLIGRSSVSSGRRSRPTPTGRFAVLEKIPEHISNRYGDYVDELGSVVRSNIDNQDIAPPAGTQFRGTKMPFFLRIVGGIGLHAGPLPGHPDSHGCIRLPPFIAQRLFNVPVGTPVSVEE